MIEAAFKLAGALFGVLVLYDCIRSRPANTPLLRVVTVAGVALVVGCYLGLWFASDIVSGAWMVTL